MGDIISFWCTSGVPVLNICSWAYFDLHWQVIMVDLLEVDWHQWLFECLEQRLFLESSQKI